MALLVDYIELTARGITDVQAQIDALVDSTNQGIDRAVVLAKALTDPKFRESARLLDAVRQANAEVLRVEQRRATLTARQQSTYGKDALSNARAEIALKKELARVDRDAARLDLTARYGSAGGRLAAFGQSRGFGLATGAAAAGAATATGLAYKGFGDTVEMNRFTNELNMVSKEFAGALRPALDLATDGLKIVRFGMERMTTAQQNLLAVSVVTVAALGALNVALYRTSGVTLMGAGSRLLGFAAPAAADAATQAATNAAGAATGTLGARLLAGAGRLAKKVPIIGAAAIPLVGAYEDSQSKESLYTLSKQAGNGKFAAGLKSAFGAAAEGFGFDNLTGTDSRRDFKRERARLQPDKFTFDEDRDASDRERLYTLSRQAGRSKFKSALNMGVGSFLEVTGDLLGTADQGRKQMRGEAAARGFAPAKGVAKADAEPEARRKVTPMLPTLFDEGGSAFERAALNVANLDAGGTPGETTLGGILGWMQERWGTTPEPKNPNDR